MPKINVDCAASSTIQSPREHRSNEGDAGFPLDVLGSSASGVLPAAPASPSSPAAEGSNAYGVVVPRKHVVVTSKVREEIPTASTSVDGSPVADNPRARVSMTTAHIAYFGNFFGLSAISPFYGLLFQAIGFSPGQVGLLSAVQPLCTLVLLPPFAYIADAYHCNRWLVMAGIVVSSVLLVMLTASTTGSNPSDATDLTWPALLVVLHFIGMTPVEPFLDNHTMSLLPPHQRNEWGTARSYGAYGWGIGAPLASQLIAVVGWPWVAVQCIIGRLGTVYGFFCASPYGTPESTALKYLQVWRFVLSHRRLALFLICTCCMGTGYVLITTFLFLFLKDLGAPEILFGLSITMTVVVEIPLFRYSAKLHERFTDRQLFTTAALSWAVRVTGYSLLQNPWLVLLLEPFHGLSFGLMWLAGVHTVGVTFPSSLAASAFGFLHAAAFGVGPVIGNIVGGQLYETLGPRVMFRCAAVFMAAMALAYRAVDAWLERAYDDVSSRGEPNTGDDNQEGDEVDLPTQRSVEMGVLPVEGH